MKRDVKKTGAHGTAELRTERLLLRRYREDDAEELYRYFGTDPLMMRYSGWNPYATEEMARETVRRFMDSYEDEHAYSWVMDLDGAVVGTIGAYDLEDGQIETGFSVVRERQGNGYAQEALKKILEYLTENEGILCVCAWCAAENEASRHVLEKAGMRYVRRDDKSLNVGGNVYDRLFFEYHLKD